jgi:N-acetylneuraminic acid mutarotase
LILRCSNKQNDSIWEARSSMSICRAFHANSVYDDKVYVFGGSTGEKNKFQDTNSAEIFDPQTNSWRNISPMPEPVTTSAAITVHNRIYIIGGQQNVFSKRINKVLMYDCVSNKWSYKSPMNIPRAFHSVAGLNDKIYAIGGRESDDEVSVKNKDSLAVYTIEEYDVSKDKWIIKKILPFKHYAIGAVAFNKKIYILSDTISNFSLSKSAILEEYDPKSNSIRQLASLSPSRYDAAITVLNKKIFVFGGWNKGSLSSVNQYDISQDEWTNLTDLPFNIQNCQAISTDGRIFINGGIIYPKDGNEKKDIMIEYFYKRDKASHQ